MHATTDDHPVVFVTWDDADAFCKWVGGRLPAGDEWNWAAQGGLQEKHVWSDQWPPPKGAGNFADESQGPLQRSACIPGYNDGYAATAPVGSLSPNGYGLHDLAGNVWEWDAHKPWCRGGSIDNYVQDSLSLDFRHERKLGDCFNSIGFRVAKSLA